MMKKKIVALCAIVLAVLVFCGGCVVDLQRFEHKESRQQTETILNALMADDSQSVYALVSHLCSETDFKTIFTQMKSVLGDEDTYELKLLSIYTRGSVSNGSKSSSVDSVYEMTMTRGKVIVNISVDDQEKISSFYLTPYERTDYYSIGTIENMDGATVMQWGFLLINIFVLGFTVYAVVDCCRHKIKKKVLWLLLLIFGFITIGARIYSTGFKFNWNVGWITAYSALIRYGSGGVMYRLMLPVGAIIYFIKRDSLLKASVPNVVIREKEETEDK